jgi:hypothetical protein
MRHVLFAAFMAAFLFLAGCSSSATTNYCVLPPIDDPAFDAAVVAAQTAADPTPKHPRVGCIPPTLRESGSVPGRLQPRIVRVIGTYDAENWKVLMPGVYDTAKWVPVPMTSVRYVGCGVEAEAFRQLITQPQGASQ